VHLKANYTWAIRTIGQRIIAKPIMVVVEVNQPKGGEHLQCTGAQTPVAETLAQGDTSEEIGYDTNGKPKPEPQLKISFRRLISTLETPSPLATRHRSRVEGWPAVIDSRAINGGSPRSP